jgi:hypothetical protein
MDAVDENAFQSGIDGKYSDQAHFLYELLQNADDAKASSARFILHRNRLIFGHNGTRRFSVSDPTTEKKDVLKGKLGDVNSITSPSRFSRNKEATIGKFGIGFNSVFQYTATPYIFEPNINFRIDRFIVPQLINFDHPERLDGETLFEFPFDLNTLKMQDAYDDISQKLRSLCHPLLFLKNLKSIDFNIGHITGFYKMKLLQTYEYYDAHVQYILMPQQYSTIIDEQKLWKFSRKTNDGHSYSVGFCADTKGNLVPANYTAFCYFPTKVHTGLNFIIHAPFLLNVTREYIQTDVEHNANLINLLARLSADSITILKDISLKTTRYIIDDNIFNIIPYDSSILDDSDDIRKINFLPFYNSLKDKFKNDSLLLSKTGYVTRNNAYWAQDNHISKLFSDEQLALLSGDNDAKWVLTSFGRKETLLKNKALVAYLDEITQTWLEDEDLIIGWQYEDHSAPAEGITATFIEKQSTEWLHRLYEWLAETESKTELIKSIPIFLDNDNNATAAFDNNGNRTLFFPSDHPNTFKTISIDLLANATTFKFVKKLGMSEPTLRDEIYNIIIPQYSQRIKIDHELNFNKFFKYFKECPINDRDGYISQIREYGFLICYHDNDSRLYHGKANDLYFPTDELHAWFKPKSTTRFVGWDDYLQSVEEHDKNVLYTFLCKLGITDKPRIYKINVSSFDALKLDIDWPRSSAPPSWVEYNLDGCTEMLDASVNSPDRSLSVILWNTLLSTIKSYCGNSDPLESIITGKYNYSFRKNRVFCYESTQAFNLRTKPWLLNSIGNFVSASKLTRRTLYSGYDTDNPDVERLLNFLKIKNDVNTGFDTDNHELNFLATLGVSLGLTNMEQQQALAEYARRKNLNLNTFTDDHEDIDSDDHKSLIPSESILPSQANDKIRSTDLTTVLEHTVNEIAKRITSSSVEFLHCQENREYRKNYEDREYLQDRKDREDREEEEEYSDLLDEDDYLKPALSLPHKVEKMMDQAEKKVRETSWLKSLRNQALNSEKYSYAWFKTLLELESMNCLEKGLSDGKISIYFSSVRIEHGTFTTLILEHPDRYVHPSIEDLSEIQVELCFSNYEIIKVITEVISVNSYSVVGKLKVKNDTEGIDLSFVTGARIETKNQLFMLDELQKAFKELANDNKYNENFNMQTNLCSNIEFVLGAPGTGKTRFLAQEIILEMMCADNDLSFLVLTPTNKSADLIVSQLIEEMGEDRSYLNWLVRFGTTSSNGIANSGVYRGRTFNIRNFKKNVTVTTIGRFSHDCFSPDSSSLLYLKDMNWDYVFIDEASMIPLANIVYPLYKANPNKFIIAGDPFQAVPASSLDVWKNENIYSLVKLNSFENPTTVPHEFKVKLLTTQYRSLGAIGEIFNRLTYGSILNHGRKPGSGLQLKFNKLIDIGPLNIIKFPALSSEGIYQPKRIKNKSNYHVYSALFALELVKYLSSITISFDENNISSIGVIVPYRAQADLICRLMCSISFPDNVHVQAGTVHDFQGDECDIVIAVFNPPPRIEEPEKSGQMFLNNLNVINLTISRARDYLFVLMPDDNTQNINNLEIIKKVEQLCKQNSFCTVYHSTEFENLIFGTPTYIEDNYFSTKHRTC